MSQCKILVVEDDPILSDLARRQLAKLGYEAVVVASGEEAIALDFTGIGLVLLDIGLPGLDGTEVAMLLREKELRAKTRRIPIIALTAHAQHKHIAIAGIDAVLPKPALLEDLKKALDTWLRFDSSSALGA